MGKPRKPQEVKSCSSCPFSDMIDHRYEIEGCQTLGESFEDITGNSKYSYVAPRFIPDKCPHKGKTLTYVYKFGKGKEAR